MAGRYCQHCGQENIVTRESFWSLCKHFVYDIIHFDGNFFHTLGTLFTRPGLVPRQYAEGKRASYLHPIRMYLFTSAIFFLVFFSIGANLINDSSGEARINKTERLRLAKDYRKKLLDNGPDSPAIKKKIALLSDTGKVLLQKDIDLSDVKDRSFDMGSVREYDSIQRALPAGQRDDWFSSLFKRKLAAADEKYKGNSKEIFNAWQEAFLHKLPYMLFVSLPFFALVLKLLYVRRKNFYYSDHATFTLFHYIFSFILLLVFFLLMKAGDWTHWNIIKLPAILLLLWGGVYLLLSMKRFYVQGWGKTVMKFLLLNLLAFLVMMILFLFFFLLSVFQI